MTTESYPEIEKLVPHRGNLLLLDRVTAMGDNSACCDVDTRASGSFRQSDGVSSAVCLEYIAQTVAAFVGWHRRQEGRPPAKGVVVSVRDFKVAAPQLGAAERLQVEVQLEWSEGVAGRFRGRVSRADAEVASATVTVVEDPNEAQV